MPIKHTAVHLAGKVDTRYLVYVTFSMQCSSCLPRDTSVTRRVLSHLLSGCQSVHCGFRTMSMMALIGPTLAEDLDFIVFDP